MNVLSYRVVASTQARTATAADVMWEQSNVIQMLSLLSSDFTETIEGGGHCVPSPHDWPSCSGTMSCRPHVDVTGKKKAA